MTLSDQKIVELDMLLSKVAHEYRNHGITRPLSHFNDLTQKFVPYSNNFTTIEIEVKENIEQFLTLDNLELRNIIAEYKSNLEKTKQTRKTAVENKRFEDAATERDNLNNLTRQLLQEVIIHNRLNEGFNIFDNQLLIVPYQDVNKQIVLQMLLESNPIIFS